MEAAHRRLQTIRRRSYIYLEIYRWIKKVQKNRDVYMKQLMTGQLLTLKLNKIRDADDRIKKKVLDFGVRTNIEHLRSIAHNYQFYQLKLI
jgi:hypothetical protein